MVSGDPWVLQTVQGYTLDLVSQPTQTKAPKELSFNHIESASLSEEVTLMLKKKAIIEIPTQQEAKGFTSQLFSVPKKDGGTRPIINLKALNLFVHKVHFKMEGIHMLKDVLKKGDWMTKIDLKDAYFMIPVAPNHRRLLRFGWQGKTTSSPVYPSACPQHHGYSPKLPNPS